MNKSQLCDGNDLEQVCSTIRQAGGVIESMDCMVGGPAGYRVNYFERKQGKPISNYVPVQTNVPGRYRMICEVTGKSQRERQMEEIPPAKVNPSNFERAVKLSPMTVTGLVPANPGSVSGVVTPNRLTNAMTEGATPSTLTKSPSHPPHKINSLPPSSPMARFLTDLDTSSPQPPK